MELKDYRAALVSGWKVVAGTVLVALLLGAAIAVTSPGAAPSYTSDRKVFLASADRDQSGPGAFPDPSMATRTISYAQVLGGSVLADRVAKRLGLKRSELGTVTATPVADSTVLQLTVLGTDKKQTKAVADAYVDLLPAAIGNADQASGGGSPAAPVRTTVISSTDVGAGDLAPSGAPRILLLAFMLGLGVGVAWALLRYQAANQTAGTRD